MGIIQLERLTREKFLPFGHVIDCARTSVSAAYPLPTDANQGYAQRFGDLAHLASSYGDIGKAKAARTVTSLFIALPRETMLLPGGEIELSSSVLERHSFTSQTFVPMGLAVNNNHTAFIVIVTTGVFIHGQDLGPDTKRMRAFLAYGDQAITYFAGTWHAPLIVVGQRPISFVAFQYMCGEKLYDCEERTVADNIVISGLDGNFEKNILKSKL